MEHVAIDEIDPMERDTGTVRPLTDALATDDVAINHYELAPGERFSGGMHTHLDQEELFVVLDGEATFETPDETTTVGAGEVVRFDAGEYQTGFNDGDDPVEAIALGAPRDSEEIRVPNPCTACGHEAMGFEQTADGARLACPECGATAPIPDQ